MQRRIVFILNGSRPLKKEMARLIDRVGEMEDMVTETLTTTAPKEAISLAERAGNEGADIVVAVGGDGTCHEVVNGIMRSEGKPLFAFLPNGTGNDFRKSLGTFNGEQWLKTLREGRSRQIDLCEVRHKDDVRYALNISGVGFDGYVIRTLMRQRENWKLNGKVSYATAIVRAFFAFRKPTLKISSAEFNAEGKILMVAACNGTTFGHGLTIAPDACPDNGVLEMVVLGKVSLMDYVRNLGRLKKGKRIHHPEAHYFQSSEVHVEAGTQSLYCESDGELTGEGSVTFRCMPGVLTILDDR